MVGDVGDDGGLANAGGTIAFFSGSGAGVLDFSWAGCPNTEGGLGLGLPKTELMVPVPPPLPKALAVEEGSVFAAPKPVADGDPVCFNAEPNELVPLCANAANPPPLEPKALVVVAAGAGLPPRLGFPNVEGWPNPD